MNTQPGSTCNGEWYMAMNDKDRTTAKGNDSKTTKSTTNDKSDELMNSKHARQWLGSRTDYKHAQRRMRWTTRSTCTSNSRNFTNGLQACINDDLYEWRIISTHNDKGWCDERRVQTTSTMKDRSWGWLTSTRSDEHNEQWLTSVRNDEHDERGSKARAKDEREDRRLLTALFQVLWQPQGSFSRGREVTGFQHGGSSLVACREGQLAPPWRSLWKNNGEWNEGMNDNAQRTERQPNTMTTNNSKHMGSVTSSRKQRARVTNRWRTARTTISMMIDERQECL